MAVPYATYTDLVGFFGASRLATCHPSDSGTTVEAHAARLILIAQLEIDGHFRHAALSTPVDTAALVTAGTITQPQADALDEKLCWTSCVIAMSLMEVTAADSDENLKRMTSQARAWLQDVSKGRAIMPQAAVRGSVGIYSPATVNPLTQDVFDLYSVVIGTR